MTSHAVCRFFCHSVRQSLRTEQVGEVGFIIEVPIETPELVLTSMSKLVGEKNMLVWCVLSRWCRNWLVNG